MAHQIASASKHPDSRTTIDRFSKIFFKVGRIKGCLLNAILVPSNECKLKALFQRETGVGEYFPQRNYYETGSVTGSATVSATLFSTFRVT